MKDLIEYIARTLVEHPDLVEVREVDSPRQLELRVSKADLGRVIGRRGKTAQAMRTLLRVAAGDDPPAELEIVQGTEPASE
jgi:predicted RNA-binding protein YlqC (UPF0109 family)